MKRSVKKALGALLILALAVQLFAGFGVKSDEANAKQVDDISAAAKQVKTLERKAYKNDGTVYEGTTLVFVPKGAASITVKKGTTVIGDEAFKDCENLISVKLPDSVTTIGNKAFYNTKSLKKIVLPKNLEKIGEYAFYESAIQSVELPKKLTVIGSYSFYYAEKLKKVTINGKVTEIGYSAFDGCSKLSSINIPKSVKIIGDRAFSGTSSLKKITLYKGIEKIGNYAFAGSGFDSLRIPSSVKEIGKSAFYSTSGNVTAASSCEACKMYKDGLYSADYGRLIAYPKDKQNIKIHPDCSTIDNGVLIETKLKKLVLPDKIENLYKYDFQKNLELEEVVLGSGLKSFEWGVFDGCPKLKKITVSEDNENYSSYNGSVYTKDKKILVCFPEGLEKVEVHKETTSFDMNIISGAYYKTEVICPDNMEDMDTLEYTRWKDKAAVSFKVKAGTKTAEGLAVNKKDYLYSLDNSDTEILAVVKQEQKSAAIKEKTCVKLGVYLGGLRVSDEFGDTNSKCKLTWKTSDKKIATVSDNGVVTGVKAGKATVTATVILKSGKKKEMSFAITVKSGKFAKGDVVCFGSYEQDNNEQNGKEPLMWTVLSATKNEALLVTQDVIEYMPMENDSWKNSTLRKWLNNDFYKAAFSSSEKKSIKTSTIDNTKYYDDEGSLKDKYTTKDKIFVLSLEDVTNPKYGFSKYYRYNDEVEDQAYNDINRRSAATEYVNKMDWFFDTAYMTNLNTSSFEEGWWLRNTSYSSYQSDGFFIYVNAEGSVSTDGCRSGYKKGVRPAMWISQ